MLKYAAKRLFTLIPVFLAVSMLTFVLGSMSSGDATRVLAERRHEHPTFEQIEAVRIEMGLDKPLLVQYGSWLGNALRGDLGTSFWIDRPVEEEIALLFPKTLELALLPVMGKLGMAFGGLLSGFSIMESIFSWNGLGKYALESIKTKNCSAVQGSVLFMVFLVDLICGAVDPRLKLL